MIQGPASSPKMRSPWRLFKASAPSWLPVTPKCHCSHCIVIYSSSSCMYNDFVASGLGLVWIQVQIVLSYVFKPSQMELVWKMQILPYNYINLNSYSGRPRQIGILGNLSDFFKHVWISNKFSSNSEAVFLLGILIQIMFVI
jgi:hypothetical protein